MDSKKGVVKPENKDMGKYLKLLQKDIGPVQMFEPSVTLHIFRATLKQTTQIYINPMR